jgi:antitoxin StbD
MANYLHTNTTASISELKKNPMGTVQAGHGEAVVILNRNEPAFYCVPAKAYELMMEIMEDIELAKIIKEREGEASHSVNLDDYV